MANFRIYDRSQRLLLPPDLNEWVADDGLAHFIVEAVEHVDMPLFRVSRTGAGKAQHHLRMMLGLLVCCHARGIFSSRRTEQATHRDVSVRFIAANTHPDHDTIAKFRRENRAAFAVSFEKVLLLAILLLAHATGLLKFGTVSVDGPKMDASASKMKSVRHDRINTLREKLQADIDALMNSAETADRSDEDGGAPPKPPKPERQTNLTDPDSNLMRKSSAHEFRQCHDAQAIADADGSQLVLGHDVLSTPNDREGLDGFLEKMSALPGKTTTLLADSGYGSGEIVAGIEGRGIDPLIAMSRQHVPRPCDFRPPKPPGKPPPKVREPWRLAMQEKLETPEGREKCRRRKSTVEPVFGIVKSVMGFTRFHPRSLQKVRTEWLLVVLAYDCKRLSKLKAA